MKTRRNQRPLANAKLRRFRWRLRDILRDPSERGLWARSHGERKFRWLLRDSSGERGPWADGTAATPYIAARV